MDKKPKLTVLTALLEFNEDIVKTFNSLKSSLSSNKLKWVIKSSKPANNDQLSVFKGFENNILFIAEEDNSLYDGLNRGLEFIDTDFFLVLGAGDVLFNGAAYFINDIILNNPDAEAFMFPVNYEDYIFPVMLEAIHYRMPCSHQGTILNTKNVLSLKGFDTKYKYVADYDLISRYCLKHSNILTSHCLIGSNKPDGLSDKNKFETALELYLIAHKYWQNKYEEFQLNETVLQNLGFVDNFLKRKKEKKQKGENMQTPSEIRQEIFSYLLNIENARKAQEHKKYEEISSSISDILKILEVANKEFEDLKLEIASLKEATNDNLKKKINKQNQVLPLTEKKHIKNILSANDKLQEIFGFNKKKLDETQKKDEPSLNEN